MEEIRRSPVEVGSWQFIPIYTGLYTSQAGAGFLPSAIPPLNVIKILKYFQYLINPLPSMYGIFTYIYHILPLK